jgi:hypothetical protein
VPDRILDDRPEDCATTGISSLSAHDINSIDDSTITDTITDNDTCGGDTEGGANRAALEGTVFTEESLKEKYNVDFIRTPEDETMVIDNPRYQGVFRIRNEKFNCVYEAHVWLVSFVRVCSLDLRMPKRGLLQIKERWWPYANWPNPEIALRGRCTIVADRSRRISSVDRSARS